MPSGTRGSIHLFRLAGVNLYLHWSWFLVAFYEIQSHDGRYHSIVWSVLEYLALFLIVLMHEFGHAMACRSVGGHADKILLWPFGGVAYVRPPQRPGATLWSIASGPLVNVALLPILYIALTVARSSGWAETMPDVYTFVRSVYWIDVILLAFNLLPVYPLDGGQILRSLLWYGMGRARSLMTATIVGFVGIAGLLALAVWTRSVWTGAISLFLLMNCWSGLQQSRALMQLARLPRRDGYLCPSCETAPPVGPFWNCEQCGQSFDVFQTQAVCPNCAQEPATTVCIDCREEHPMRDWIVGAAAGMGLVSGSFAAK